LVIDCPPGTKDIFDELVSVLREDILGAIVIGQSDTVDDVGRMTKVCNHNYVPIIGYIENMSGVWAEGQLVKGPKSGNMIAPFGRGSVEALVDQIGGRYLGPIPLCNDHSDIENAAANTIKAIAVAVGDSDPAEIPNLKQGDKGFVRNVRGALKATGQTVKDELDVTGIQERFGNPNNPKIICVELTDAQGSWMLPSKIYLKVEGGLKVLRNPDEVYGGVKISSQELKFALEGERMTMDSPTASFLHLCKKLKPFSRIPVFNLTLNFIPCYSISVLSNKLLDELFIIKSFFNGLKVVFFKLTPFYIHV